MKLAICDDSTEFLDIIEEYIVRLKSTSLVYDMYKSGEKLIDEYKNGARYDAVILDMEMEGINGLEVAEILRSIDRRVVIVFSTAHEKYMRESFEYEPFRYLVKPYEFDKFKEVYSKLYNKINDHYEKFVFYENREHTSVYLEDILYFESKGHYIYIYLKNGTIHKLRQTVGQLEELLDKRIFVKIHRAFIVNMAHIYKVTSNGIKMHSISKEIPLSDRYRKQLNQGISHFMERNFKI